MNGIMTETAGLNVGSNANIYFVLSTIDVKLSSSKLYKRNFKKGIAISVNICYNIYRN